MTWNEYPSFTRNERIADGVVHVLSLTASITAVILLLTLAGASPGLTAALVIYAIALIGSFAASACYHMTPWTGARPVLRRFDHAAIYAKIAGTYTPLVVMIGSAFAYVVLGVIWALAAFGAMQRLFRAAPPGRWASALYMGLGWLSLLLAWPAIQTLPPAGSLLILAGGLIYTVGVGFFHWESLRYQNAIWHGFVLAGSAAFFAAIAVGSAAL